MDYKKIYDNLMSSRIELKNERILKKLNGEYFEGHHIIPKSKGGNGYSNRPNNCENIVLLTPREHFLSHWLLWLIYRDRSSALAFHKMLSINNKQKRIYNSIGYEVARLSYVTTNKGNKYGKNNKGRKMSDEQKRNLSKKMTGRYNGNDNPFYGKKHTSETLRKLSENRIGKYKNEFNSGYKGKKEIYKNGILIKTFNTTEEVANFINTSCSNVRHVLGGKQKTANGYLIKYKKGS